MLRILLNNNAGSQYVSFVLDLNGNVHNVSLCKYNYGFLLNIPVIIMLKYFYTSSLVRIVFVIIKNGNKIV